MTYTNGTALALGRSPELLHAIDDADTAARELLTLACLLDGSAGIDAARMDGLALMLTGIYEDVWRLLELLGDKL